VDTDGFISIPPPHEMAVPSPSSPHWHVPEQDEPTLVIPAPTPATHPHHRPSPLQSASSTSISQLNLVSPPQQSTMQNPKGCRSLSVIPETISAKATPNSGMIGTLRVDWQSDIHKVSCMIHLQKLSEPLLVYV